MQPFDKIPDFWLGIVTGIACCAVVSWGAFVILLRLILRSEERYAKTWVDEDKDLDMEGSGTRYTPPPKVPPES